MKRLLWCYRQYPQRIAGVFAFLLSNNAVWKPRFNRLSPVVWQPDDVDRKRPVWQWSWSFFFTSLVIMVSWSLGSGKIFQIVTTKVIAGCSEPERDLPPCDLFDTGTVVIPGIGLVLTGLSDEFNSIGLGNKRKYWVRLLVDTLVLSYSSVPDCIAVLIFQKIFSDIQFLFPVYALAPGFHLHCVL